MSAIGFAPFPEASDVDQLRSAYRTLHRLQTNLENLETCLKKGNLKQAEHHFAIAKWNAEEAKKEIAAIGQSKRGVILERIKCASQERDACRLWRVRLQA